MRYLLFIFLILHQVCRADEMSAYKFLKEKAQSTKPEHEFNEYEDIISGSLAFVIGNVGYFTTESSALKLAYSGVQTVGIVAIGHGIYDYYYPHFESRMLGLLSEKQVSRGKLANGYVSLLGEMNRAKRLSLLWSSSLLTIQYGLNSLLGDDIPQDMKDIYLFLGGINAIVATYSYFNISDYEQYYLKHRDEPKLGFFIIPGGTGLAVTKSF